MAVIRPPPGPARPAPRGASWPGRRADTTAACSRAGPAAGGRDVRRWKVLPFRRPLAPVGVPERPLEGLEPRQPLGLPQPLVREVARHRLRRIRGRREQVGPPVPGRSSRTRSSAARTAGEIGTRLARPCLSVSAGHRMAPWGPRSNRRSSYRNAQMAESRRPVPFARSRSSERWLRTTLVSPARSVRRSSARRSRADFRGVR